ncbi:single-stranded-DNA-specific exonuclease RecJ [Candidatus Saccharibacteria bacterium]|nr:single-stranded-DNA-specific exonuclease RecJ [Candidatus Saccharibacteria bacterium]
MKRAEDIFEQLLAARGLADPAARKAYLHPGYEDFRHDPFLLPDMEPAVARIITARDKGEKVFIYGDYDIDGLTATSVLLDALPRFGITDLHAFIPNRFVEGYGLTKEAVQQLVDRGAQLIITVDCGSLSHKEIEHARAAGVDVIVTDHHNVAPVMPPAVATINPKRPDHSYPFIDLAGVGVAFKLVQALQSRIDGLPVGHEKWLLDLVALGTVCDVVTLKDENRANVHWGLKVMQKTRRPGLRALAAVAGVDIAAVYARQLGFVLGPHLNASGRLETAQRSLDVLIAPDIDAGMEAAGVLRQMNLDRRAQQDIIFQAAREQAAQYADDPVLVLSHAEWSHGIIGIVAAKILELYKKPTYVLQEMEGQAKGSARSYGDFSAADAIRAAEEHIIKGGGHKLAAGVTLRPEKIPDFRQAVNDYFRSLKLGPQAQLLDPVADLTLTSLTGVDERLVDMIDGMEPFGNGNPQPVFRLAGMRVLARREMGAEKTHLKLTLGDEAERPIDVIAFGKAQEIGARPGNQVDAWCTLDINEWNGRRSVQGRLLKIEA